ncbi:Vacuolar protein sorting-associated protein 33 [Rhizoctonia solani]|uniref:Vacuolar protein sorting-associated protein 33 n=1 Tax=Rhizoctonia solani TaxID=456999 RepID=A0A0K6GAF0_9AGAM|nr:Vacuolar protein sorting-associated protein 33 [Rhizoctonia solani]
MSRLRLPKISRVASARDVSETRNPSAPTIGDRPAPHCARTDASSPSVQVPSAGPSTSGETQKLNWKHLREFARVSNLFGPLKTFADELIECAHIYERVSDNREEFKLLQTRLEALFEELNKHLTPEAPPVMTKSIKNICRAIQVELVHVQSKQDKSRLRQAIEIAESSKQVLACYGRIQDHLHRLLLNVNLSAWKGINELVAETRLTKLTLTHSPQYDSGYGLKLGRRGCTPGTRIDVLAHISQWLDNPYSDSVYWLNGLAGTGKTTITYSICTQLHTEGRLAASFSVPAYQLARFSRPFQFELLQALEENPDVHRTLPNIQFGNLVSRPLERAREPWPLNSIIIIDALDECENKAGVSLILDIILTKSKNLPMKFFVSSRPESIIRDLMSQPVVVTKLALHELDESTVQGDIEKYLKESLAPINPSNQQIAMLVEHVGVRFIHAATIVILVGCLKSGQKSAPLRRLDIILNILSTSRNGGTGTNDIDMATSILQEIFKDWTLDETKKDDVKLVLRALMCAREPDASTILTLPELIQFNDEDRVNSALNCLLSKVYTVWSNKLIMYLPADLCHDYSLTCPFQVAMSGTRGSTHLNSGYVVSNVLPPQSVLTEFPGYIWPIDPLATIPQASIQQIDESPTQIHFSNVVLSSYSSPSPSHRLTGNSSAIFTRSNNHLSQNIIPLTSGQASLYNALLSLGGGTQSMLEETASQSNAPLPPVALRGPAWPSSNSSDENDEDHEDSDSEKSEDDDHEGVKHAMRTTVMPDANVEANTLSFVLQSYAQWVNFMIFDPKNVVHVIREGVIAQFSSSQDNRTRVILLSNVFGALGKSPVLNSKVRSVVTYLSAEAHQSIVRFTSTEPAPLREIDMMNALKSIDLMMEVILLRRFGGSMSTIIGLMEAASPVFRRACPEPLGQLVNLPNILVSPSINLRHYAETDIMNATLLARPMFLRYDILYTPEINEQFTGQQAGLHWLHGIPDQLIILLAWINMLHEDLGTNVDPLLISQIEMEVERVKITPSTSDDPLYTIRRFAVQECWRLVVYIHLYVTLCGAHAEDPRVVKFVKRFVRFLGGVKPARTVDTFLSLPIMFIGTFVSRKQDRDLLFRRLTTMQECTMPGRAGHDCLMVLCDI